MDGANTVMINDIAPYIRTMNITGNGAIIPPAMMRLSLTMVAPTANRSQVLRKASKWLCAIKY